MARDARDSSPPSRPAPMASEAAFAGQGQDPAQGHVGAFLEPALPLAGLAGGEGVVLVGGEADLDRRQAVGGAGGAGHGGVLRVEEGNALKPSAPAGTRRIARWGGSSATRTG